MVNLQYGPTLPVEQSSLRKTRAQDLIFSSRTAEATYYYIAALVSETIEFLSCRARMVVVGDSTVDVAHPVLKRVREVLHVSKIRGANVLEVYANSAHYREVFALYSRP